MTESMFDLGLGDSLVGITDYCIHPAQETARLPKVGGPKNPRVDEILGLKPDLVLANWEENSRKTVESLQTAGIPVWVTFPRTVDHAVKILWDLANLFHSQGAVDRIKKIEAELEQVRSDNAQRQTVRCFCPIWYEHTQSGYPWWMTFNQNTYCHDLLAVFGVENVFAGRQRRYPLDADLGFGAAQEATGRDTRYPRVSLEEVRSAMPELILLPDEPFPFNETHRQAINEYLVHSPAVQNQRVFLLDGSLITWHGTRLERALQEFIGIFDF
jgi:ABC-type Fe3+-hydroxamate transport system substrate-binding protein